MKIDAFMQTLPIMGYGMLGIFVVMAIIYLAVLIIGKLTMKQQPEPAEKT